MPYTFGNRSQKRLATCHPDLQRVMRDALAVSDVDFSIVEGHRTVERQNWLYNQEPPRTTIDGITRKGKHNYDPSEAVDIVVYTSQKYFRKRIAYDWTHLAYIAGVVTSTARRLYADGVIDHLVKWGGNWDGDGILKLDQNFQDGPHFELYVP